MIIMRDERVDVLKAQRGGGEEWGKMFHLVGRRDDDFRCSIWWGEG